jgi:hypothetical protein
MIEPREHWGERGEEAQIEEESAYSLFLEGLGA